VFKYLNFKTHISAAVLLCLLALSFSSACVEKPGEGKQAQQGFAAADPIIAALENYKNEQGRYPRRLRELVPQYLEKDPQKNPEKDDAGEIRFIYYPAEENTSYNLRMSYPTLFGADECRYTPTEKKWACGGAM
jgi:hypothetical protein